MSQVIMTIYRRRQLCRASAGQETLIPIKYFAVGTDGKDETGALIEPDGTEVALKQEIIRREVETRFEQDDTKCFYLLKLSPAEYENREISEIGLFDANGKLAIYKTCSFDASSFEEGVIFTITEAF